MTDSKGTSEMSRDQLRKDRAEAIEDFLKRFAPSDNADILAQMMVTVCRLGDDGTDRGDVKILNAAMKELRYAFKVFAPYAEIPKVTIFGSARTPEEHPQYQAAKNFAEIIQRKGWMVITGAGDGIMRAGHHGATRESSFGVAISLPFEQDTNDVIEGDSKLVNFKYFFTRKLMFVKEAKAIVLFPGGFGTQDECFESLTLVQTAKSMPVPIVLVDEPGGTYWQHWRTYVKAELLGNSMLDEADMDLFHVTDDAQEAADTILQFYKRYHSLRYVGDDLVMRLEWPLTEATIAELTEEFSDIIVEGGITQRNDGLPEERGAYPGKTRMIFRFDRRNSGRLRAMIKSINAAP